MNLFLLRATKSKRTLPSVRVVLVPLPELDVAKVQRYCRRRVPAEALHQVRLELDVTAAAVTIVERRAPWRPETGPEWTSFPIARIRYSPTTRRWTLYWRDRNLRFHRYQPLDPTPSIEAVLDEISADPTAIFWG